MGLMCWVTAPEKIKNSATSDTVHIEHTESRCRAAHQCAQKCRLMVTRWDGDEELKDEET